MAAGGLAGASSLVFVYSLDYARTRLANDAKRPGPPPPRLRPRRGAMPHALEAGGGGLPGARATPAQPASGGGCLPQPSWAVCATGEGAHQGHTSREGERDDKAPPAHTQHQHPQPTQGRAGPPPPTTRGPPQPDPVFSETPLSPLGWVWVMIY